MGGLYEKKVYFNKSVVKYFFFTSFLNILYTIISVLSLRYNYTSIPANGNDAEFRFIIFDTMSQVIYKSFIDFQIIIYFVLKGTLSFFYVYIAILVARIIRYSFVEKITIPNMDMVLYVFYILSNILRIIISFQWVLRSRAYFYERYTQVCDSMISASINYYTIYYMLEGCSLLIINHCIFTVFMWIYSNQYSSFTQIANLFWTGVTACIGWYCLWIDKQYIQQKWFVWIFYLLNVIRVAVIYLRTGEIRLHLNIYYRDATDSEKLYKIITATEYTPETVRNLALNILDNLEYFIIGIIYNVSFLWYCVFLYRLNGKNPRLDNKGRSPIERVELSSSEGLQVAQV
ncbi:hypothetical protein NEMIN01_1389 [Nematocida minor]|uniref:uncharacterized protein n=1 Tax=Nematocida minor TaxID=1912983 RepID=UPI002220298B|nr:uncharacterized protein NEMIN01_1389 [Nematocida minor]KAI5191120.1 hypothetical protein NEMIN01_1389 [Nematocida minor]